MTGSTVKGSILFLSKRIDAASTRYRIFQYVQLLQNVGWETDYHSTSFKGLGLVARWRLIQRCKRFSIVVIQRKLFDTLTLNLIQRANPNIVFDYDDAIFLNDDGTDSARRMRRFKQTTHIAKLALAGNRYLAEKSASAGTHVLPTTIVFANYTSLQSSKKVVDNALTLVWIGSRSTKKYLEQHRDIFEAIGKAKPNVRLKVIADFEIHFKHLATDCILWNAETELQELIDADIGVAPMTDDPWTRGKCALKVIQYMACGLPVISSDAGANAEIVIENETGFLARSTEEWLTAIDTLEDARKRTELGTKGRIRAEQYYSAESQSTKINSLFTALLTR